MIDTVVLHLVRVSIISALLAPVLMLLARPIARREPGFGAAFRPLFVTQLITYFATGMLAMLLSELGVGPIQGLGLMVGVVVLTSMLALELETPLPRAAATAVVLILAIALAGPAMAWAQQALAELAPAPRR